MSEKHDKIRATECELGFAEDALTSEYATYGRLVYHDGLGGHRQQDIEWTSKQIVLKIADVRRIEAEMDELARASE